MDEQSAGGGSPSCAHPQSKDRSRKKRLKGGQDAEEGRVLSRSLSNKSLAAS